MSVHSRLAKFSSMVLADGGGTVSMTGGPRQLGTEVADATVSPGMWKALQESMASKGQALKGFASANRTPLAGALGAAGGIGAGVGLAALARPNQQPY